VSARIISANRLSDCPQQRGRLPRSIALHRAPSHICCPRFHPAGLLCAVPNSHPLAAPRDALRRELSRPRDALLLPQASSVPPICAPTPRLSATNPTSAPRTSSRTPP